MLAIALWMVGIAIAVSVMVITVAVEFYSLQFALGAVTATFIAVAAMRDYGIAEAQKRGAAHRCAILVRHMGILWGWAAVSVSVIYGLIMVWAVDWIPLFVVLILGCSTCMFIANLLERDAQSNIDDKNVIAFVDRMVWAQFVVICLLIGGLIAMGKFGPSSFSNENKWAAMNILLSSGLGLAIISGFSILNAITAGGSLSGAALGTKTPNHTLEKIEPQARRRRPAARIV